MSNSFATFWTVAYQAPLSVGFPRQEHWTRLPFPSPGNLYNPGIKPRSPAFQADSLPLSHRRSPYIHIDCLACCSPWGRKELDMTGQLNNNYYNYIYRENIHRQIYFKELVNTHTHILHWSVSLERPIYCTFY